MRNCDSRYSEQQGNVSDREIQIGVTWTLRSGQWKSSHVVRTNFNTFSRKQDGTKVCTCWNYYLNIILVGFEGICLKMCQQKYLKKGKFKFQVWFWQHVPGQWCTTATTTSPTASPTSYPSHQRLINPLWLDGRVTILVSDWLQDDISIKARSLFSVVSSVGINVAGLPPLCEWGIIIETWTN